MADLYDTTLLATRIPGAPRMRISTGVLEMASGRRCLNAMLTLDCDDNGISTHVTVALDPCAMRAMARVLTEHATRMQVELIPLLSTARPDPEVIAYEAFAAAGREAA